MRGRGRAVGLLGGCALPGPRRRPRPRTASRSPGRSMSAGCRGATAADQGIVKKWADKYGISIEVVQINDYVESINQYTAGAFDGCVMTNMDALTIPPPAASTARR